MSSPIAAIVISILSWWLATGVVIIVARRGSGRGVVTMGLMTGAAMAALWAITLSAQIVSVGGVYVAFASAIVVWAWHEVSFLLGIITGPRRTACPVDATERERFSAAFAAVRDHELLLFATMIGLIWLLRDAPNQTAMWSFVLLWVMRVSTKLNIFLGAPNAVSDLLPARLDYLKSYFRTDRVSPIFVSSLCLAVLITLTCVFHANLALSQAHTVSWTILATFATLGIIEHLFLVTPIRDADLWPMFVPKRKTLSTKAITDQVIVSTKPEPTMKKSTARQGA